MSGHMNSQAAKSINLFTTGYGCAAEWNNVIKVYTQYAQEQTHTQLGIYRSIQLLQPLWDRIGVCCSTVNTV